MIHSTYKANTQLTSSTTLKCTFCKQEKSLEAFSKTQITKATYNPYAPPGFNNTNKKSISCKSCTIESKKTLRCMTCGKEMPLERFAKSQRKHADRSRCIKCMKRREDEDVWASESDSDSSGDWDDLQ
ncbi:hypothetical protein BCR42DRAFT_408214 [Absidia repens]|uniref:Stc1 domain-containing protein n=1 Tax=Absidia repens TaxID=90262 RepID=A0A1X2IPK5_9FUNG|nr:hypothetical protein BCR42DRAFT_408214 [Absidia repens]